MTSKGRNVTYSYLIKQAELHWLIPLLDWNNKVAPSREYPFLGYIAGFLYIERMDKRIVDDNRRHLQALLRQIREDAHLHQSDVARHLGRPQSFVSKYETGERRLDIVELRYVCEALGISLQEFVRRFEESLGNEASGPFSASAQAFLGECSD